MRILHCESGYLDRNLALEDGCEARCLVGDCVQTIVGDIRGLVPKPGGGLLAFGGHGTVSHIQEDLSVSSWPIGSTGRVSAVIVANDTLIAAVDGGGIFRSADGGYLWDRVVSAREPGRIQVAGCPGDHERVVAVVGQTRLIESTDGGRRFVGLLDTPFAVVGLDCHPDGRLTVDDPKQRWQVQRTDGLASLSALPEPRPTPVASPDSYRLADKPVALVDGVVEAGQRALLDPVHNIELLRASAPSLRVTRVRSVSPDGETRTIVSPSIEGVVFATDEAGGVWRSGNEGASFVRINGAQFTAGKPEMVAGTLDGLVACGRRGLYASRDAGLTWGLVSSGHTGCIDMLETPEGVVFVTGDGAVRMGGTR